MLKKFSFEFIFSSTSLYIFFGVLFFVLPFLFSVQTIDITLVPRFLLLSATLTVLALLIVFRLHAYRFDFIRLALFPLLFLYLLFSVISLIQSVNFSEGLFECAKTALWVILILITTLFYLHYIKFKTYLVYSVIISAFFLSGIGILQYYDIAFTFIPGNVIPYSTMANKNLFASAVFLMLPFCIYGLLCFTSYWKILSALVSITILWAVFITQSRTVWLAMIVALSVCGIAAIISFSVTIPRVKIRKILFLFIIMAGMLVFFLKYKPTSVMQHKMFIAMSNTLSINERFVLWNKTIAMIEDNLWKGVGAGNWKIIMPGYGVSDLVKEAKIGKLHYQSPENDFLWVFAETGIGGFITYILIFLLLFYYALRIIRYTKNKHDKALSWLMLFGIIGYVCIACFSFPKERIFHLSCVAMMIAVTAGIYFETFVSGKKISKQWGTWILIGSLMFSIIALYIGYFRWKGEVNTKKAMIEREKQNHKSVILKIDNAFSFFYTIDPMTTPLYFYRGTANFGLNKIQEALIDYETAQRYHPYHIHVLNNIGTCYMLLGNTKKAIEYYQKAVAISPVFQDAMMNLCVVYYTLEEYKKAYTILLLCKPETPDLNRFREIDNVLKKKIE